jgi:hypothetical protein
MDVVAKSLSSTLLQEAQGLHEKSRAWLAEMPIEPNEVKKKGNREMAEVSPQEAAQLYVSGKPVVEVAKDLGITYGKARKLISLSGTSLRDSSTRLKGRTRPNKSVS